VVLIFVAAATGVPELGCTQQRNAGEWLAANVTLQAVTVPVPTLTVPL
jgi:hypothetical protein